MAGPTKYQTVWLASQTGGWGPTHIPTLSASDALDCEPIVTPLVQEALAPEVGYAGAHSVPPVAGSKAGAQITIKGQFHGWSASTPTGAPTATPEQVLLEWVFGGVTRGGYSTDLVTGGDATHIVVTSGAETTSGLALMPPLDSSVATRGIGWVKDHASNTYTLVGAMKDAPLDSGTVYGSATFYLDPTATPNPFSIRLRGATAEADKIYFDCYVSGSCKLELSAKGQWTYEVPVVALGVLEDTAAGSYGPLDQAVASPAALTYPRIPAATQINGSRLAIDGTEACWGTVALTIDVPTPGLDDLTCHNAYQGVGEVYVLRRTAMLEMEGLDTAQDSLRAPGDSVGAIQIDSNTTPGRACSVLIPAAFASEKETPIDKGGLLGSKLVARPGVYTGDTETNAQNDTPLRLALL